MKYGIEEAVRILRQFFLELGNQEDAVLPGLAGQPVRLRSGNLGRHACGVFGRGQMQDLVGKALYAALAEGNQSYRQFQCSRYDTPGRACCRYG